MAFLPLSVSATWSGALRPPSGPGGAVLEGHTLRAASCAKWREKSFDLANLIASGDHKVTEFRCAFGVNFHSGPLSRRQRASVPPDRANRRLRISPMLQSRDARLEAAQRVTRAKGTRK